MDYRVRYHNGQDKKDDETVVRAHSPAEAMMKFRCMRDDRPGRREVSVTSVWPVPDMTDAQW